MIQRTMTMVAVAALLTMSPDISEAQPVSTYPGLSVSFRDLTGTGTTTESFEVWMRIVNTAPTDFNFNGSAPGDAFGLPLMDLPRVGRDLFGSQVSFVDYTRAFLLPFWECGSFNDCGGAGPYDFNFNVGANSFYGVMDLNIAKDGGTYDYLLGTLSPTGGSALPGTYRFFNSGFFLGVEGLDAIGGPLLATIDLDVAAACANGVTHPECNFVRVIGGSVTPVTTVTPEPATFFMLGGGFAALLAVRLRRRRHS